MRNRGGGAAKFNSATTIVAQKSGKTATFTATANSWYVAVGSYCNSVSNRGWGGGPNWTVENSNVIIPLNGGQSNGNGTLYHAGYACLFHTERAVDTKCAYTCSSADAADWRIKIFKLE